MSAIIENLTESTDIINTLLDSLALGSLDEHDLQYCLEQLKDINDKSIDFLKN